MARAKPTARPRFKQTYPETYATTIELTTRHLKPGTREPDAILDYEDRAQQRTGTCALYLIANAVPQDAPHDRPA